MEYSRLANSSEIEEALSDISISMGVPNQQGIGAGKGVREGKPDAEVDWAPFPMLKTINDGKRHPCRLHRLWVPIVF
jgi:hypothetical protein